MLNSPKSYEKHKHFESPLTKTKKLNKLKTEKVFLGVIIDEHLAWKSHMAHVANKISKPITIICRCSYYSLKPPLLYDLSLFAIL